MRKKAKIFTPEEHDALVAALREQKQPPPKTELTVTDMLEGELGGLLVSRKHEGWTMRDIKVWLEDQGVAVSPRTLSVTLKRLEESNPQHQPGDIRKGDAPPVAEFLNAEEDDL